MPQQNREHNEIFSPVTGISSLDSETSQIPEPCSVHTDHSLVQSFIEATQSLSVSDRSNPSASGETASSKPRDSPIRPTQPRTPCQRLRSLTQQVISHVSSNMLGRIRFDQDNTEENDVGRSSTSVINQEDERPVVFNTPRVKEGSIKLPPQPILIPQMGNLEPDWINLDETEDLQPLELIGTNNKDKIVRFNGTHEADQSLETHGIESDAELSQSLSFIARERADTEPRFFARSYRDKGKGRLIEEYIEPSTPSEALTGRYNEPIRLTERLKDQIPPLFRTKSAEDMKGEDMSPSPPPPPPSSPRPKPIKLRESGPTPSLFNGYHNKKSPFTTTTNHESFYNQGQESNKSQTNLPHKIDQFIDPLSPLSDGHSVATVNGNNEPSPPKSNFLSPLSHLKGLFIRTINGDSA